MAQSKDKVVKAGKLIWQGDKGAIQERMLNAGIVLVVGRDPSSDIMISNKLVSKRHALFYWDGDECLIVDQDSANGTLVNGSKISTETKLKDGDRIEIGDTVFSYYFLGDRMVEGLKTMPLSAPERSDQPTVAQPIDEGAKPPPPPQPETARQSPDEPKPKPKIESMPTMIVGATVKEAKEAKAPQEPSPPNEPEATMPFAGTGAQAAEKPPAASGSDAVDLFAQLLEQTQASHASAQAVQDRWLSVRAKLEEIVARLDKNAPRMSELSGKVREAALIDLLDNLTNTPTDVTLLVQLGTHSALLSKLIKAYFNQEGVINLINEELKGELGRIGD